MDYGKVERMDTEGPTVEDKAGGASHAGWPVVIRPERLRLVDLEARIGREPALARAIASRPSFARSLARAVLTLDSSAGLAGSDLDELTERLICLGNRPSAPVIK